MDYLEIEKNNLIIKCLAGSHTYGTNTLESDIDYRGVFIPDVDYWLGTQNIDQTSCNDTNDVTYFALRKFMQLAAANNPNILEILFLKDNFYLWQDIPSWRAVLGKRLIAKRNIFLSKKCKHTYLGYAYSQFGRMDRLNKNANTNPKRVALVEKFGMDTKNASHMLRLLRMCLELLTEGELNVWRADHKELLDVRNGKYTYEELQGQFEKYRGLIEEAYVRSALPHSPDHKAINNLCVELAQEFLEIEIGR